MNVIGEDIVLIAQSLRSLLQPLDRQAVGRIDTGRTQDADYHPMPPPEDSQLVLRIDTTRSTRGRRVCCARFVNSRTGTVAINATGAYINKSLW